MANDEQVRHELFTKTATYEGAEGTEMLLLDP